MRKMLLFFLVYIEWRVAVLCKIERIDELYIRFGCACADCMLNAEYWTLQWIPIECNVWPGITISQYYLVFVYNSHGFGDDIFFFARSFPKPNKLVAERVFFFCSHDLIDDMCDALGIHGRERGHKLMGIRFGFGPFPHRLGECAVFGRRRQIRNVQSMLNRFGGFFSLWGHIYDES